MAKQAQIDAVRPVLTDIDKGVTVTEKAIDAIVENSEKVTETLEAGLEKVADVVPETLEKSVEVTAEVAKKGVGSLRNPKTVAVLVIGISMVAGAGLGFLGYKLMKKRLEQQYEERMERELDEMRTFYIRRNKKDEYATPATTAEAMQVREAQEALDNYQGKEATSKGASLKVVAKDGDAANEKTRYDKVVTNEEAKAEIRDHVVTVEVEETPDKRNVFVNGRPLVDDEWNMEAEEARRVPEVPYVINHDEFMENTFEHSQTSLTYFSGDDVLTDERDVMIPDVDSLVGPDSLSRFGHGSRDPRIVYVRNERNETDYEIRLSDGKFAEEVMDFRHSDTPTPHLRKARWGDDE